MPVPQDSPLEIFPLILNIKKLTLMTIGIYELVFSLCVLVIEEFYFSSAPFLGGSTEIGPVLENE